MKQTLRENYDKFWSKEAVEASEVSVKKMEVLSSVMKVCSWNVIPGDITMQVFLRIVIHSLWRIYKDAAIPEKHPHTSLPERSDNCSRHF